MESYKQEFIEFMVESQVLKLGEFTFKERKKISVFHERRCIRDRSAASQAGRVLCESHP